MTWLIRAAQNTDVSDFWRCRTEALRIGCAQHYSAAVLGQWLAQPMPDLTVLFQRSFTLVAELNGEVVAGGFMAPSLRVATSGPLRAGSAESAQGDDEPLCRWQLQGLFVTPRCFGLGVGRDLYRQLEQHALKNAAQRIELEASLNAIGFYQRLGFQSLGRSDYQHPAGFTIACELMAKRLHSKAPL